MSANLKLLEALRDAWPVAVWRDSHVLAAVSGGADSMALLCALVETKQKSGGAGRVFAGHINHGIRGAASDEDEKWLRQECQTLEVPLTVRRVDTAALAAEEGDGVEAAAREARYRFLTAMAEELGARFVATAHTRDDQVETVLFRLFRGTGLRGMSGIQPSRPLSPSVSLVRPLLACDREEVLRYLESRGQGFREDESNAVRDFARNRVRHDLLPYLRENFNPDVDAAIVRAATVAAEAQQVIESLATDWLDGNCEMQESSSACGGRVIAIRVESLAGRPELLVCEILRIAWRRAGFAEQAMTQAWWRQLAQFAKERRDGGVLNLPGNVRASWVEPGVLSLAAPRTS